MWLATVMTQWVNQWLKISKPGATGPKMNTQSKKNWHQMTSCACSTRKISACGVFPASRWLSGISSRPHGTAVQAGSTFGVVSGAGHEVPTERRAVSSCHMAAGYLRTLSDAPALPCLGAACEAAYLTAAQHSTDIIQNKKNSCRYSRNILCNTVVTTTAWKRFQNNKGFSERYMLAGWPEWHLACKKCHLSQSIFFQKKWRKKTKGATQFTWETVIKMEVVKWWYVTRFTLNRFT